MPLFYYTCDKCNKQYRKLSDEIAPERIREALSELHSSQLRIAEAEVQGALAHNHRDENAVHHLELAAKMLADARAKIHDLIADPLCPVCATSLKRTPKPPTTTIFETLDNGVMARKVTRIAGAEEIFKERAQNDPRYKDPTK